MRSCVELSHDPKGRAVDEQHRPPTSVAVIAVAWRAQRRVHTTYKRLASRGERSVVATAAVARELLGSSARSGGSFRSTAEPRPHLTIRSCEDAGAVEGILEFMLDKPQRLMSVPRARQPSDAPSSWGIQSPHKSLATDYKIRRPHRCGSMII